MSEKEDESGRHERMKSKLKYTPDGMKTKMKVLLEGMKESLGQDEVAAVKE